MSGNNLSDMIIKQRERDRTPELHFRLPSISKLALALATLGGSVYLAKRGIQRFESDEIRRLRRQIGRRPF